MLPKWSARGKDINFLVVTTPSKVAFETNAEINETIKGLEGSHCWVYREPRALAGKLGKSLEWIVSQRVEIKS